MNQKNNPALADFSVLDLKKELVEIKKQIQEAIGSTPDYSGEADLLLNVIENLQEGIANIKNVNELEKRSQARVLADMALFNSMLSTMFGGEEDEDFDFDDLDEDEEEHEHKEIEGDDECGGCGGHHHDKKSP